MKQTFSQIMDQIKYEENNFAYLDDILGPYKPMNLAQLIPVIAKNYLDNLLGELKTYVHNLRFITENNHSLTLDELLDINTNVIKLGFSIEAPVGENIVVKINIPEHTDQTYFTRYVDNFLELIKVKTVYDCLEFNKDEEYANGVTHHSPFLYNETLSKYKEARRFFRNFAKELNKNPLERLERKEHHMNQSFYEIIEQIKDGTITFHNSDEVLDSHTPTNTDQLIYIIAENYAEKLVDDLGSHTEECFFRTDYSDMAIFELLNENKRATGIYFDINAPKESNVIVEINFPEYNSETDFEEYIDDLLDLIDNKTIESCLEFDADDEFNELWDKSSYYTTREFLEMLNEDEEYFREFADDVKSYR